MLRFEAHADALEGRSGCSFRDMSRFDRPMGKLRTVGIRVRIAFQSEGWSKSPALR
jgi:hypothetical protein